MRRLYLRPYPGVILLCKNRGEYKKWSAWCNDGKPDDISPSAQGRMCLHKYKNNMPHFTVWATDSARLAHEFSHCILMTFSDCGIDPIAANGEPFCYLLSQLLIEAK